MNALTFKRINDGWARGEAAVAMAMLLLMLVVAFAQALLRNLTQAGFSWANEALAWLDWGDFILQKGTLWLAFLGASLAVQSDKHVAIDILPRLVSPRARVLMRSLVGFIGAVILYFLAKAFMDAIAVNGAERPANVEVFTDNGAVHICEATAAQLSDTGSSTGPFCIVRSFLSLFGVHMETPGAAFQLIVPVMLIVMSVRSFANGVHDALKFSRGEVIDDASEHGLVGASHDLAADLDRKDGEP